MFYVFVPLPKQFSLFACGSMGIGVPADGIELEPPDRLPRINVASGLLRPYHIASVIHTSLHGMCRRFGYRLRVQYNLDYINQFVLKKVDIIERRLSYLFFFIFFIFFGAAHRPHAEKLI